MNRVWFVFTLSFLVVTEGGGLFQQRVPTANAPRTKYPLVFGKSAIRRFIEGNGYGYENYTITTEDGYLLNLNRIIHPNRTKAERGYPLLLVNGFFMQSEAWLVQQRLDSNIALVLANHGYDVWLGDQRGTMRSRGHVNLTTADKEFWDFSFHETGIYDLPAFIDFVLEKTGSKDLIFSCMSLGCSFHAVLASKKPSYNQKIRAAIYFVPLVNNIRKISDMNSVTHVWFRFQPIVVDIFEKAGVLDWFPFMGNLKKEVYHLCLPQSEFQVLIAKLTWGTAFHIPTEAFCSILGLSTGGANVKSTKHVLQVYDTGDFAEYDYGREENKKRYGTEWAPLYDMSQITSPIALYYSDADVFASPKRVKVNSENRKTTYRADRIYFAYGVVSPTETADEAVGEIYPICPGVEKTIKSLGGPSYSCRLPNFNHLDVAAGTTFRYVLPDVIDLVNSLTGASNDTGKFKSGKCPSMEWIRHL